MRTEDQLRARALKMLTDGLKHEPQAIAWAVRTVSTLRNSDVVELTSQGFSMREISLGMTEWQ